MKILDQYAVRDLANEIYRQLLAAGHSEATIAAIGASLLAHSVAAIANDVPDMRVGLRSYHDDLLGQAPAIFLAVQTPKGEA